MFKNPGTFNPALCLRVFFAIIHQAGVLKGGDVSEIFGKVSTIPAPTKVLIGYRVNVSLLMGGALSGRGNGG